MSGETLFSLLIMAAFFWITRKKPKKEPPAIRPTRLVDKEKRGISSPLERARREKKEKPVLKQSPYRVETKKEGAFFLKELKNKNSLQKAFILSEVLKTVDEREKR